jgi:hypothetical protein
MGVQNRDPFYRLRAIDGAQCLMAKGWPDANNTDGKRVAFCITATTGKPTRELAARMDNLADLLNDLFERRFEY